MDGSPHRRIPVYTPLLTEADARAALRAVEHGWITSAGPPDANPVARFEDAWRRRTGMPHAVAVANGTAALELAVAALGLGPGDEVICPAFTIISCVRAVVLSGATPVLADVDPRTWCIDPNDVERKIGPRTRAVLGVHAFGTPYDHESLSRLASGRIAVIEDAAQAHGARVRIGDAKVECGGLGDVAVFSFYVNKPVTTGEGGMVLAKEAHLAERVRNSANLFFGKVRRFVHESLGHNYRMSGLQAALGLSQLERLDETVALKRRIAAAYRARLSDVQEIELQESNPADEPIFWMNGLVLSDSFRGDATGLAASLARRGVETRPFFVGFHEQPALLRRGLFRNERHPVTERLSRRGLYLPSGLDLDEETIDYVVRVLEQALVDAGPEQVTVSTTLETAELSADEGPAEAALAFGPAFAEAYDALYSEKGYAGEVTLLEGAIQRHGTPGMRRVLDLGCGTGRHALELSSRGFDVVGVDRSPSMLEIARARAPSLRFVEADMAEVDLGETFDVVVILFAALSYQTTPDGILRALGAARRHLRPSGLLIADVWFGASSAEPGTSTTTYRTGRKADVAWERLGTIMRDPLEQRVRLSYELRRAQGGHTSVARETHSMHYFSRFELEFALRNSGFRLSALTAETDLDRAPASSDLTALFVATAC
jgi:perosamine synthetase